MKPEKFDISSYKLDEYMLKQETKEPEVKAHDKRVFDMIRLLRKNGRMKAQDIADALDLKTTKTISIYKKYIERLGYEIKSYHGFYGGFELVNEHFTENEMDYLKKVLCEGCKQPQLFEKLEKINNFI